LNFKWPPRLRDRARGTQFALIEITAALASSEEGRAQLLNGIGDAATFSIYAGLTAAFIVVTWLWVPETRGVSVKGIERRLLSGVRLRDIGQPATHR
jgi:hypothetical protein